MDISETNKVLSSEDVEIILSMFNVVSARGGFLPDEFIVIGQLYNKLSSKDKDKDNNEKNITLTPEDLELLLSTINILAKRGGFLPVDFKVIGTLYEKLV